MAGFADALDRRMEDIDRPPPPPIGHYIARVTKAPGTPQERQGTDKNGKPYHFESVSVMLQLVEPTEDVDPDDLEAFGGDLSAVQVSKDFLFSKLEGSETDNEKTLFQFKRFLEHCGIDVSEGTVKSQMAELPNAQCIVELRHRPDPNDPEVVYAQAGRTAPV